MDLRYNPASDYAYIMLEHGRVVCTRRLPGIHRMVDYDGLGRPLGVILRELRRGVDVSGLPLADEIAELLESLGIAVNYGADGPAASIRDFNSYRRRVPAGLDATPDALLEPHHHDAAA